MIFEKSYNSCVPKKNTLYFPFDKLSSTTLAGQNEYPFTLANTRSPILYEVTIDFFLTILNFVKINSYFKFLHRIKSLCF